MRRCELDGTKRIWDLIFWYSIFTYRFLLIVLIILLVRSALTTIEVALILYNSMSKVTDFIKNSGELFKVIKGFNLSCERVFSIMDDTKFTKEKFGTKHLAEIDGEFEFKNVSFSYVEGKSVLNKMSFKINPKETVAFVGKSGVGRYKNFQKSEYRAHQKPKYNIAQNQSFVQKEIGAKYKTIHIWSYSQNLVIPCYY